MLAFAHDIDFLYSNTAKDVLSDQQERIGVEPCAWLRLENKPLHLFDFPRVLRRRHWIRHGFSSEHVGVIKT